MEQRALEQRATLLAEELAAARRSCAELPEDERRSRLRQTLEDSLDGLTDEDAQRIVQSVRDGMIRKAQEHEKYVADLEAQIAQLRLQLDSVTAEKDRLAAQPGSNQASRGTAFSSVEPDMLGIFREGLIKATKKEAVSAEALELPHHQARMFDMVHALLTFALNYTEGADGLRKEFGIGLTKHMNTVMWNEWIKQLRQRFRACLDNEEGSLRELHELLDRNSRFLIFLNEAYAACIYEGCQKMLGVMDPESIKQQHKRALGHNIEKAYDSISQIHNDLSNLTGSELWGQYFLEAFQTRLSTSLGE